MLLRRTARPLLATWFVTEGLDAVRSPAAHVAAARPCADALLAHSERAARPSDAQLRTIVQVHGALTAAAGLALALGKAPRTAALVLAGLTAPLAVASLPLPRGAKASPEVRRERRDRLVRALAFTGAALLAAVDREGRPGVSWRLAQARGLATSHDGAEHAKAAVTPR